MGMGKRIKARLIDLGWQQVDLLARVPGLTAGSLSALILRDSNRSQWSSEIAEALGVSHRWLQTGDGPMGAKAAQELSAWQPRTRVPLVSWSELAERTMNNNDAFPPTEAAGWVGARYSTPGRRAFALTVETDSMTASQGEHSFPRGSVIIIDPDRPASPGDFVVATDPVSGSPTFKRLATDAGRFFLTPLNPAFPSTPIASLDAVVGVCVEWQNGGAL